METFTAVRNIKKRNEGSVKIDSAVYLRQRKMANARKRKFLDRMTAEQKEIKRAKDREYHKKKKREMRLKKIADLTEQEKEKKRTSWKKASQKYREAKRNSTEITSNKQSLPKDESAPKKARRQGVRKVVGREDSYNEIKELEKRINQKKQELKYLKEQAQTREAKKKQAPTIPDSKVDDSFKDLRVPSQIQQNHQFSEFLNTKLQVKADALLKSYKTGEVFEICNIEFTTREENILHKAINILQKEENSNIIILNFDVKFHEIMGCYQQDNGSETRIFKINCLRKIIC